MTADRPKPHQTIAVAEIELCQSTGRRRELRGEGTERGTIAEELVTTEPIVVVLHGPEARAFTRAN